MTKLHKFKESLKESIEFIDKIIKLFGSWDAVYDMVGEDGSLTIEDITQTINDVLIYDK